MGKIKLKLVIFAISMLQPLPLFVSCINWFLPEITNRGLFKLFAALLMCGAIVLIVMTMFYKKHKVMGVIAI